MVVEAVGFEAAQASNIATEVETSFPHEKENGKLDQELGDKPIKFGTHGDEPVKGDGGDALDANFPKEAVDEWPAPKQIHYFYFVKYRPYDDPKIKVKIDQADKEIQKRNQSRFQIMEELKLKRSDRAGVIAQVKSLRTESDQYYTIMGEKKKEREPLYQALGKLRDSGGAGRGGICSSEEELDDLIYSLNYRLQHESIPLTEEKQILREIKQVEGTREKVIANAAARTKIQDEMGQKQVIQDQYKLIGADLDGVRKEHQAVKSKITVLKEKLKSMDDDISSLQNELANATQKRDKALESIHEFRKQRDEGNAYFFQSRVLLNKARDLAAKKDIEALEELSSTELDKFISLWSNNKTIREDYEKRILSSLDQRQLSRDGRIRNPDEKPLVQVPEAPVPSKVEAVAKTNVKQPKEESKAPSQKDTLPVQKSKAGLTDPKPISEGIDIADKEDNSYEISHKDDNSYEISHKDSTSKKEEVVDPGKLKEMKREEEMVKAKQAMERKKKLAEKAAAKAAIRAQKEAEKKLKKEEKKLKKKSGGSALATETEEPAEAVVESAEMVKDEHEVAPVPAKEKVARENPVRLRRNPRGPDSVPRAMLKRKKSTTNYWLWAAPVAVMILSLLVLGYFYLL
ncbi:proton pump-interactor 1-like [Tripterygium wilfordii]|uniref:proton pump-interactor 1-like n=1 Tax=Tripterygium wilfordii TaxID=458696 RepID=UPI0018F8062F|nr:proton pump-interactor 1-like [Tripterygium wilfordii]